MALKWLEEKSDEAVEGIDAAILDMFKSLSNPSHVRVLECITEKPRRFNDIKRYLNLHPETLSRNLRDLQGHKLAKATDEGYVITAFGSHVLDVVRDLSKAGGI